MAERGAHTYAEIISQPAVWAEALAVFASQAAALSRFWQQHTFDQVIFTGCGSTYYLSLTGAALFQAQTGIPTRAYPASELVFYPEAAYFKNSKTLLVAVSRSGETTETVEAVQVFREIAQGKVITVGCYSESRLVQAADLALIVDSAREESVAQTRSFSTMTVLVQLLAAHCAGAGDHTSLADLPQVCARLLDEYNLQAQQLGEDQAINQFFFLGSQHLYGIACEAMLKMKEMSLSHSEAFHTLEFRHGPMSMVTERTLITGLLTPTAHVHELAVVQQMHARGARTLALAEEASWLTNGIQDNRVVLDSHLPAWSRPVLYLPVLQLLAYYRAMANGQNPDRPANLDAVVSLGSLRS